MEEAYKIVIMIMKLMGNTLLYLVGNWSFLTPRLQDSIKTTTTQVTTAATTNTNSIITTNGNDENPSKLL